MFKYPSNSDDDDEDDVSDSEHYSLPLVVLKSPLL